MNKKTYQSWMVQAGWQRVPLKPDPAFHMDLGDRTLQAVPKFTELPDKFVLEDHAGVLVGAFTAAKVEIFPTFHTTACAVVRRINGRSETGLPGAPEFVAEVTEMLRTWAFGIDIDAEIHAHAAERDDYGMESWNHVIALAVLGRTEALEAWRASVADGGDPRLHPRVTVEALDRAIAVAHRVTAS